MRLDEAGEAFIKSFEGFSLHAYLDVAGNPTIGWGHRILPDDTSPITEMEAETLFETDVLRTERAVNDVSISLSQNEFNALVDFGFNVGPQAFLDSELFKKLNLGDKRGASKEIMRWVYCKDPITKQPKIDQSIVKRRVAEQALFNSGDPALSNKTPGLLV